MLKVMSLEVKAGVIKRVTGMDSSRKRISDYRGFDSKAASTKYTVNKCNGEEIGIRWHQ